MCALNNHQNVISIFLNSKICFSYEGNVRLNYSKYGQIFTTFLFVFLDNGNESLLSELQRAL